MGWDRTVPQLPHFEPTPHNVAKPAIRQRLNSASGHMSCSSWPGRQQRYIVNGKENVMRRSVSLSAVGFIAIALIGLATGPVWGDDPLYGVAATVSSPTVVITTASVDPGASAAVV